MISSEDSYYTYEYSGYFKILPQINDWNKNKKRIKKGIKVSNGFTYSSEKYKVDEQIDLQKWLTNKKIYWEILIHIVKIYLLA